MSTWLPGAVAHLKALGPALRPIDHCPPGPPPDLWPPIGPGLDGLAMADARAPLAGPARQRSLGLPADAGALPGLQPTVLADWLAFHPQPRRLRPATVPGAEAALEVTPADLATFTGRPLGAFPTERYLALPAARDATGAPPGALPFDIRGHPVAQSASGRQLLDQLQRDVALAHERATRRRDRPAAAAADDFRALQDALSELKGRDEDAVLRNTERLVQLANEVPPPPAAGLESPAAAAHHAMRLLQYSGHMCDISFDVLVTALLCKEPEEVPHRLRCGRVISFYRCNRIEVWVIWDRVYFPNGGFRILRPEWISSLRVAELSRCQFGGLCEVEEGLCG